MGYLEHWNFKDKPFEEVCDTRFFFESEDHREALDRMLYVVNDRNMNMGLLTGEIGSGKTITKNVFIGSLPSTNFEVLSFENSNFCFLDLLFDITKRLTLKSRQSARTSSLGETALPGRNDRYLLMQQFKQQLESIFYEERKHLVLVFDEAQQIEDVVLDEIKNLTNLSSPSESFLTIFFVGQPELREKVKRLRQVDQRVFLRFHLNNLDYNGSIKYIHHRLRVAGRDHDGVFSSTALELIFRFTEGVPREINRLCKLALNVGFAQGAETLGTEEIQMIIDDLRVQGG
jgi:general secretion pathway protein A